MPDSREPPTASPQWSSGHQSFPGWPLHCAQRHLTQATGGGKQRQARQRGAQGGSVPQQQPPSLWDPEGEQGCRQQTEEPYVGCLDCVASRTRGGRNG